MNKRQKEIIQHQLTMERLVLDELEKEYKAALKDINMKLRLFQSMPETQSKIYQRQYQETLKKQIEAALEKLHSDEYTTINEYLHDCYTDAFVGTFYDLHGQGAPIIAPIDQNAAIKAVMTDTRLNKPLYSKLGIDVNKLKRVVSSEISRGIAGGLMYEEIARNIQFRTNAPISRAKTIVRTEGHRIQQASTEDARQTAKAKGANVVKQWDATLDGDTRPTHRRLDGQIRETDEPFEMDGKKAMYPGDFGDPAEDCNCRCVALTRSRAALDEDELKTLKERAEFFGLDKTKEFEDFKQKYLKAADAVENQKTFVPAKTIEEAEEYAKKFVSQYKSSLTGKVDYKGIEIEYANEMNRAFTEVLEAYQVKYPLRNIIPMNTREKRFKGTTAEAAYAFGSGDLFYNKSYYKTKKAFVAHVKEYNDLLDVIMPKIDRVIADVSKDNSYSGKAKLRYFSAMKKTGRTNVGDVGAYGSTIHELGHYLDDELFGKEIRNRGIDLNESFAKYSGGISAYATTDKMEYIAESFNAYWNGETEALDPDIIAVFKELRK